MPANTPFRMIFFDLGRFEEVRSDGQDYEKHEISFSDVKSGQKESVHRHPANYWRSNAGKSAKSIKQIIFPK